MKTMLGFSGGRGSAAEEISTQPSMDKSRDGMSNFFMI
jgi:hypothetical protein